MSATKHMIFDGHFITLLLVITMTYDVTMTSRVDVDLAHAQHDGHRRARHHAELGDDDGDELRRRDVVHQVEQAERRQAAPLVEVGATPHQVGGVTWPEPERDSITPPPPIVNIIILYDVDSVFVC